MPVRRRFVQSWVSLLVLAFLAALVNPAAGQGWGANHGIKGSRPRAMRALAASAPETRGGWGVGKPDGPVRRPHPDWGLAPPESKRDDERRTQRPWTWPDLHFPRPTGSRPTLTTSRPRTQVRAAPAVRPAATVQSNPAPQVKPRRNSAPAITSYAGAAGPPESYADDYAQSFGHADETLPSAEGDLGEDELDIDELDFPEESDDAVEDDSGEAENDAAGSTTNSGAAGMDDPIPGPADLPTGGGDTSNSTDTDPPKDKGPTTKDTGPGEELGTTAPPTATGPEVGPAGAGSGPTNGPSTGNEAGPPTSGGGWGNGPPSKPDDGWTRPPNPGPGLDGYGPKPYPDRFDPKRPGQENWDWSIEREPFKDQRHPFTNEEVFDPKTGQEIRPAGVGVQWNVGHPPRRDVPQQNGPRESELPYYNALPAVPEQKPSSPEVVPPPSPSPGPPWDPSKRSSDEKDDQPDARPKSSDAHRTDRLQTVKGRADDGVSQFANDALRTVTGVDMIETVQNGAQRFIDVLETATKAYVDLTKSDADRPPAQQPQRPGDAAERERARSEQERRAREQQELANEQREREDKARKAERFLAAERAWQAAEGAEFGKTHGPRPKDPEQAQQWDRDRVQAIRDHRQKQLDVKIELESSTSEGSIRG